MSARRFESYPREAVILAGGLGTRLRGAVPDRPKPMAPIHGRPFLEYLLDYWISQGIDSFVLSIGFLHEHITAHFGTTYRGAAIRYAIEEVPLGTGGALLQATPLLQTEHPFLVMNGDTFFEVPLLDLAAAHQQRQSGWTIALLRTRRAGRYTGVAIDESGKIISLGSAAKADNHGILVNGGVYLIQTPDFSDSGFVAGDSLSLEEELLPLWCAKSPALHGVAYSARFIDIGVPADYQRAEEFFRLTVRDKEVRTSNTGSITNNKTQS